MILPGLELLTKNKHQPKDLVINLILGRICHIDMQFSNFIGMLIIFDTTTIDNLHCFMFRGWEGDK